MMDHSFIHINQNTSVLLLSSVETTKPNKWHLDINNLDSFWYLELPICYLKIEILVIFVLSADFLLSTLFLCYKLSDIYDEATLGLGYCHFLGNV